MASRRRRRLNMRIRYTTDGSDPTPDSPIYDGPIALLRSATIRAAAEMHGTMGSVVSRSYQVVAAQALVLNDELLILNDKALTLKSVK